VRARLVFDATGAGALLKRRRARAPAAQVAYGQLLSGAELPWPEDGGATLMDFTGPAKEERPTFLYALPMGRGRVFVEETSLASTPPLPLETARARLRRRLDALGVRGEVVEEERCFIPLGRPIPDRQQRVVGFGAAASMTHPAPGYLVASALERAPHVARAVCEGLTAGADAGALARAAWACVWPDERVRTRELQQFGMSVVARLHGDDQRTFFDAFFTAAGDEWRVLMSAEADATDLGRVMDKTFLALPIRLRAVASRRLMLGHPKLVPHLARALVSQRFNPRRALVGERAG
jgi:lycopene beta-cyclase